MEPGDFGPHLSGVTVIAVRRGKFDFIRPSFLGLFVLHVMTDEIFVRYFCRSIASLVDFSKPSRCMGKQAACCILIF